MGRAGRRGVLQLDGRLPPPQAAIANSQVKSECMHVAVCRCSPLYKWSRRPPPLLPLPGAWPLKLASWPLVQQAGAHEHELVVSLSDFDIGKVRIAPLPPLQALRVPSSRELRPGPALTGSPEASSQFCLKPATLAVLQSKLRLDAFLAARLPAASRARLQASIKEGLVVVNGRPQVGTSRGSQVDEPGCLSCKRQLEVDVVDCKAWSVKRPACAGAVRQELIGHALTVSTG